MKVSGFTFIRNAVKFKYPIVEAIRSVLPICDDFYVAVGKSEDDTLGLIKSIDPEKVKVVETVWDEAVRTDGKVYALETDKAFQAIPEDTDWAFYIQGDEAIHEQYLPIVKKAMEKWNDKPEVDGLLFKYMHFYGSYDYVGNSERWYPNEIRVIKNNKKIYSYKDAQGFRKNDNEKLRVKPVDAYIYHYGWVKDPRDQNEKRKNFAKLYNPSLNAESEILASGKFDYSDIDSLALFKGTHPKVMQEVIAKKNWSFDYDLSWNKTTLKNRGKRLVKKLTGIELGYKNYKLV